MSLKKLGRYEANVRFTRGGPKLRCESCLELRPVSEFEDPDGSGYLSECRECRSESLPEGREPLVGERICRGFELMGDYDE